ncbi:hypothetical protein N7603_05195 [Acholeplasma vituli]|uniref:Uncharacterized protein n=1 Tax=Paracholeplasma vituli TaxID=69473 RepID=A0ABT2PZ76_9MOLU|nr:hypothetical protein [Paracholeplasma vituli]MCU0105047.1 hypothetical protein [Paracholeplasma vituli]
MIQINAKNYESKQKERFDTLFRRVLTAYAITNETAHQLKSTRVSLESLHDQIQELNRQYENSLIRYTKDYSNQLSDINRKHQESLHELDENYAQSLKHFKQTIVDENIQANKKLTEIHINFQRQTQQTNVHIYRALLDMKQQHQAIDFEYDQAKTAYQKSIDEIEVAKIQKLKDIDSVYENELKDNKAADQARLARLSSENQRIQSKRSIEQTDYEESILKIKTIFNRVTIKFNQKIRDIQKKYQSIMGQQEASIQKEIDQIQELMDGLKVTFQEQERSTRDEFELELIKYDKRFDQLKINYESNKDQIVRNYSRDITVSNSRLAHQKELLNQQIIELEKHTKQRRLDLSVEDPDYREKMANINKNYIKDYNNLEHQAKIAMRDTAKQNLERKKRYQQELLTHEFEYIRNQEIYRLKRLFSERHKDQALKQHKYAFDKEWLILSNQNKLLEKRLFIENQILREKQGLEIYPYEAMVLLAREIHDAETNYRTLENNHYRQLFSLKERKLTYLSTIDENTIKHEKNKIIQKHEFDIKRTNVVAYLDMEYAKNELSGKKIILEEQKKSHELHYQKREKFYLFDQDKAKEIRMFDQKMISFSQKLLGQIVEVQESKALIEYDSHVELEKSRYTKEIGIRKAKRILDTSMNETQRQKRLFDIYFQMILVIQNEFENILLLLRDIYQTSSIQQWRASLSYIHEILQEQTALKSDIIKKLESETTAYYQEKINELTAFKYMNLKESIISDYESEHKLYVEQISMLDEQLKSLRSKGADLFQQIAHLQNENANIEATKDLINEQISKLTTRLLNKQQRKTARNLKNQISQLNKEINKNNDLIKHIKGQIRQTNKEMLSLDKNHKPLELMLVKIEKNRALREKNLDRSQYEEGRVYYDSIDAIEALTKLIHANNESLLSETKALLTELDRDVILEKSFSSNYIYLTKKAIKTRTKFLEFHKQGIELCDQQFIQIRNEQHRIMREYENAFSLTKHNIDHTLNKRTQKMEEKINELEKYRIAFTRVQKRQLEAQIRSIDQAMKHFDEQHQDQVALGQQSLNNAIERRDSLLQATKLNTENVIADLEIKYKTANAAIDSENAIAYKDLSRKISSIDSEIKQATLVFDEKIAFYGEKDKAARTRISDNLNQSRSKSNRKIVQFQLEIEMLKLQMKRQAKRAEVLYTKKMNRLSLRERLAQYPIRFETSKTIRQRKTLAKRTWLHRNNQMKQ